MTLIQHHLITLLPLLTLGFLGWLISLKKNNVTVVDTLWPMFFLAVVASGFFLSDYSSHRALLVLCLVAIWSFRLSMYLHLRNHNKAEDYRYRSIRQRNQPNFRFKSIYLVFLLQAMLAWFISLPLSVSIQSTAQLNFFDYWGVVLWMLGMFFQVIGDWQLASFKSKPENKNQVLMSGVWRYTRHPNYFGESAIWFAYGFLALATGAWWAMISPILMTFLLVRITGVALLESEITERRPAYKTYIQNTHCFIPWFPKKAAE